VKPRVDEWSLGLDSFLDIVTNVIGFLVLVALLAAIGSQNMSVLLGTPIIRAAPAGAARVLFECRHNRVQQIDDETINRTILQALRPLRTESGAQLDISQLPAVLQQTDVGDAFYRARAKVEQQAGAAELVLIYEPRSARQGEPLDDLRLPTSRYGAIIRSLDPQKHFVYFIVRQDSFEVFREARALARDQGLAVGWNPILLDEELRFGEGGVLGKEVQN
jgi:hypothetical protein